MPEPDATATAAPTANICELPAEEGKCKAYLPRYYFSTALGQCERFIYGGCGGNANRFSSLSDCAERCGGRRQPEVQPTEPPPPDRQPQTEAPDAYIPLPTAAPDVCAQLPSGGHCDQRLPRYYFNAALRRCFTFIYSGCGGNGNSFATEAECRARCQPGADGATQPPLVGGADDGAATTADYDYPGPQESAFDAESSSAGAGGRVETSTLGDDYSTIDYSEADYDLLGGTGDSDADATVPFNYADSDYYEYYE